MFFGEELEFRECFRKKIRGTSCPQLGIRGIRLIRDKAKKIRVLSKASILDKHKKHCSISC